LVAGFPRPRTTADRCNTRAGEAGAKVAAAAPVTPADVDIKVTLFHFHLDGGGGSGVFKTRIAAGVVARADDDEFARLACFLNAGVHQIRIPLAGASAAGAIPGADMRAQVQRDEDDIVRVFRAVERAGKLGGI